MMGHQGDDDVEDVQHTGWPQFSPDSDSERILKIGEYLMKLRRTKYGANFLATLYTAVALRQQRSKASWTWMTICSS